MSWGQILFAWAYLSGAAASVIPIGRVALRFLTQGGRPGRIDVGVALLLGVTLSALWPLMLAGAVVAEQLRDEVERQSDEAEEGTR